MLGKIDIKTLDENLEDDKYQNLDQFQRELMLIFTNCRMYNEDGTTYVKWYLNLTNARLFRVINVH